MAPNDGSEGTDTGRAARRRDDRRVVVHLRSFLSLIDRKALVVAFLALSVTSSLSEVAVLLLIVTGASGVLTDEPVVIDAGPIEIATELDVVIVAALVGTGVLIASRLAAGFLASRLSSDLLQEVRRRIVDDLLDAPWEEQSLVSAVRLQDLVSSQSIRLGGLLAKLSNCATAFIAFVAMVLASFLVDPVTAAALVAIGGLLALAFRPLTRRVRRTAQTHLHDTHAYIAAVSDIRGVLPEVRVYGVSRAAKEAHEQANRRVAVAFRRMRNAAIIQPALYLGVVLLMLVTGIALLAQQDQVDVARAGAIVLVLMRGLRYSQSAQANWQFSVENLPLIEDFENIRAQLRHRDRAAGTAQLDRIGVIELDRVSYAYPTGEVAVSEANLRIEPGQIVGLAGPSGAGKTTLAHVIMGLRRPSSGRVLVDGEPADSFDDESWFSRFAYVAQQPVLLDRDVRENVRFLRDIDDETVSLALSRAAMDPDLQGWGTGERRAVGIAGSELSGGQRQRIAIARALAGDPDVLVLDEPTSALDPDAERAVRDTLDSLRGELTVILIAHRESTLAACDVTVRLADGRIGAIEPTSVQT